MLLSVACSGMWALRLNLIEPKRIGKKGTGKEKWRWIATETILIRYSHIYTHCHTHTMDPNITSNEAKEKQHEKDNAHFVFDNNKSVQWWSNATWTELVDFSVVCHISILFARCWKVSLFCYFGCCVRLAVPPLGLIDISIFPSVCCFSFSFVGLIWLFAVCLCVAHFSALSFFEKIFAAECAYVREWAWVNLMATTMIWPSNRYYNRSRWCRPCVLGGSLRLNVWNRINPSNTIEITQKKTLRVHVFIGTPNLSLSSYVPLEFVFFHRILCCAFCTLWQQNPVDVIQMNGKIHNRTQALAQTQPNRDYRPDFFSKNTEFCSYFSLAHWRTASKACNR